VDSSFATQQYIQEQIREGVDVDDLLVHPETVDDDLWQYEQLRLVGFAHFAI